MYKYCYSNDSAIMSAGGASVGLRKCLFDQVFGVQDHSFQKLAINGDGL